MLAVARLFRKRRRKCRDGNDPAAPQLSGAVPEKLFVLRSRNRRRWKAWGPPCKSQRDAHVSLTLAMLFTSQSGNGGQTYPCSRQRAVEVVVRKVQLLKFWRGACPGGREGPREAVAAHVEPPQGREARLGAALLQGPSNPVVPHVQDLEALERPRAQPLWQRRRREPVVLQQVRGPKVR